MSPSNITYTEITLNEDEVLEYVLMLEHKGAQIAPNKFCFDTISDAQDFMSKVNRIRLKLKELT